MKNKIFPLTNVVLYAKGWYQQSDDIFKDLIEILKLDNYTPFTKSDVFSIITSNFENFDVRQSNLKEFLIGVHPSECWKYGYYVKQNHNWSNKTESELPDYDLITASIYYILSTLRFIDNKQWIFKVPKYKLYKRNPEISIKTVIEVFNKKKVEHEEVN